jgi:hypothetical protein
MRGWRHLSGAAGDTGVVEQDHFPVFGEAIGDRGIPIRHASQILKVAMELRCAESG